MQRPNTCAWCSFSSHHSAPKRHCCHPQVTFVRWMSLCRTSKQLQKKERSTDVGPGLPDPTLCTFTEWFSSHKSCHRRLAHPFLIEPAYPQAPQPSQCYWALGFTYGRATAVSRYCPWQTCDTSAGDSLVGWAAFTTVFLGATPSVGRTHAEFQTTALYGSLWNARHP